MALDVDVVKITRVGDRDTSRVDIVAVRGRRGGCRHRASRVGTSRVLAGRRCEMSVRRGVEGVNRAMTPGGGGRGEFQFCV